MGIFEKEKRVLDLTREKEKELLRRIREMDKAEKIQDSSGMVDLTPQSATGQSSNENAGALGFLSNLASAGTSNFSMSGSSEINELKIKLEDAEYKLERTLERLQRVEEKLENFERKVG